MTLIDQHRRAWLLFGLYCALLFPLGSVAVEAKKDRCEGTKKQRKQKLEKREITDNQLEEMIAQYKQEIEADYGQMNQAAFRRLEREYEEHKKSGAPFAFIGTDEAYASVVEFYANPDPKWVRKRKGFVWLPSRVSMMFDRQHMRALQELGRKMGADPSSWQTEIPDAYTVEGNWLSSD